MEEELNVQRCVFLSTYVYCLGTFTWASLRLCGCVMTILPCAAQRGGQVNTGVFSESSFEYYFFLPSTAGDQIPPGLIFTSCLLKLAHPSDNRLHWHVILSSDFFVCSWCWLGQLKGLINQ